MTLALLSDACVPGAPAAPCGLVSMRLTCPSPWLITCSALQGGCPRRPPAPSSADSWPGEPPSLSALPGVLTAYLSAELTPALAAPPASAPEPTSPDPFPTHCISPPLPSLLLTKCALVFPLYLSTAAGLFGLCLFLRNPGAHPSVLSDLTPCRPSTAPRGGREHHLVAPVEGQRRCPALRDLGARGARPPDLPPLSPTPRFVPQLR